MALTELRLLSLIEGTTYSMRAGGVCLFRQDLCKSLIYEIASQFPEPPPLRGHFLTLLSLYSLYTLFWPTPTAPISVHISLPQKTSRISLIPGIIFNQQQLEQHNDKQFHQLFQHNFQLIISISIYRSSSSSFISPSRSGRRTRISSSRINAFSLKR